jgi:hypothetical protein
MKELVFLLEENLNKNTKTRTKSDRYPPKDLDSIMARFFLSVLKKDGTEYEPDSLGSMYNSLDRHLRDMNSPIRYVLTFLSFKIVNIHHKFA